MSESVTSSGHDKERLRAYLSDVEDARVAKTDDAVEKVNPQQPETAASERASDHEAPSVSQVANPARDQVADGLVDNEASRQPVAEAATVEPHLQDGKYRGLGGLINRYLPIWRTIVALQEQICAQNTQTEKLQEQICAQNTHTEKLQCELAEVSDRHLALYEAIRLREQREGKSPDDQARMDKWYQDLQELHRGSGESLLSVQRSYVHHFNERAKELRLAGPILDLGCGRGEWLSLMSQEGWAVRGVDSSEQAVSEARGKGVDVELGDLVEVLMACPENSLAGATAFQVIEHLPFPRITALMHAAFRALVPGGILLLETPNPENLQVSSYGFWMDPTHRHPIPPPLIMDLSFHVGFRDGSILRQNPWPQWQEGETESALEREVGFRLFGPQDYALLVFKPTLAA